MARSVSVSDSTKEFLSRWYDAPLIEDTPVLRSSLIGLLFGMSGQHAVTINGTIHLTQHATDVESDLGIVLLGHEFFHVAQQKEMGWWSFLRSYLVGWRPSHISNGSSHPMEQPTYERGNEIWYALHAPDDATTDATT